MKKIYPLLFSAECAPDSKVENGFLKDNTLDEVIETYMGNLLGDSVFRYFRGNLPVCARIVSQRKRGSIIVSPDNQVAMSRYGCWGKERVIYILGAKKESSIYIGFQRNISASDIYERCMAGNILEAMNEIEPEEGETFYIEAGVPFCIGAGVEYAEISQNSPADFEIQKLEDLIEVLDYINIGAYLPQYVAPEETMFRVERVAITKPQNIAPDEAESFMLFINLDSPLCVQAKDIRHSAVDSENSVVMQKNELLLVPHDISSLTISPEKGSEGVAFLRVYLQDIPQLDTSALKDEDEQVSEHHHKEGCDCGHTHGDECDCGHEHTHLS